MPEVSQRLTSRMTLALRILFLTLRVLSNDIVAGLMGITLQ